MLAARLGGALVLAGFVLFAACGGGTDSGGGGAGGAGGGGSKATSAPRPRTAKQWTEDFCAVAKGFAATSEQFSAELNKLDLAKASARDDVIGRYAKFRDDEVKYIARVKQLGPPGIAGGDQVFAIWTTDLDEALVNLDDVIARVKATAAADFKSQYGEIITDYRDEFGQKARRSRLEALLPQFPGVQKVIEAADNKEGCAAVLFDE
jgi:hypothetical protein